MFVVFWEVTQLLFHSSEKEVISVAKKAKKAAKKTAKKKK
jgi:hypothetical protein